MSVNPSKRFGLDIEIKDGAKANFAVFDLEKEYIVNPNEFLSKGKATPFEGMKFNGVCKLTALDGKVVYNN